MILGKFFNQYYFMKFLNNNYACLLKQNKVKLALFSDSALGWESFLAAAKKC
jgi:hypothetical protein